LELESQLKAQGEATLAQKQQTQAVTSKLKLVEAKNKKLREDFELIKGEKE